LTQFQPNPDTPVLNVTGTKVALGPLNRSYIPLYHRWVNDFETISTYYTGDLTPETQDNTTLRYEQMSKDPSFTIYEVATLRPIGMCGLRKVDYFNRTGEFGILIGGKQDRGKGFGTEATRLTLDWGFIGMGLHSILLTAFSYNRAGVQAYLRAGFREVGRWREAKRFAGRAYDVVFMDCLAAEFKGSVLSSQIPD
jgi:diamine N-acetyltransferase